MSNIEVTEYLTVPYITYLIEKTGISLSCTSKSLIPAPKEPQKVTEYLTVVEGIAAMIRINC